MPNDVQKFHVSSNLFIPCRQLRLSFEFVMQEPRSCKQDICALNISVRSASGHRRSPGIARSTWGRYLYPWTFHGHLAAALPSFLYIHGIHSLNEVLRWNPNFDEVTQSLHGWITPNFHGQKIGVRHGKQHCLYNKTWRCLGFWF